MKPFAFAFLGLLWTTGWAWAQEKTCYQCGGAGTICYEDCDDSKGSDLGGDKTAACTILYSSLSRADGVCKRLDGPAPQTAPAHAKTCYSCGSTGTICREDCDGLKGSEASAADSAACTILYNSLSRADGVCRPAQAGAVGGFINLGPAGHEAIAAPLSEAIGNAIRRALSEPSFDQKK